MGEYRRETIKLEKLTINLGNPRFDQKENQRDAIIAMVNDQEKKIINLSKDIIENGVNPSDVIMVSEMDSDTYVVLEGNRRVVALKLLLNPDIIKNENESFYKKIIKLSSVFNAKPIKALDCVVFDEYKDANKWIVLKHTGENEGKGVVEWDAQQKRRFEEHTKGKMNVSLQIINFLSKRDDVDDSLKANFDKIPITNLERLVEDKKVQEFLGIKIENGLFESKVEEKEVVKGLVKIVRDLIDKRVKVKKIYKKEDRQRYLNEFTPEEKPDTKRTSKEVWGLGESLVDKRKIIPRSLKSTKSRNKLIPSGYVLKIRQPRINDVFIELKALKFDKYTNAIAILFRVFLEMSVDEYMSNKKIGTKEEIESKLRLREKITKVIEYMCKENIMTSKELKPLRVAVSDKDDVISIDTFNGYVHNRYFQPKEKDLIKSWENLSTFILKLWC
ncbi:MAG: hypothetical protein CVV21_01135 [Candidatus Goldiibacteriota bacterium HGW-Goldbacteria-1]|jgi:hypothetical protein|nr:MAG: hypothetical protein CVV21_01135 [Candidatus Goldiibacteriota bacterium HGW-Goldbacteria-1]